MMKGKFATAINCIDGRVQIPVLDWVKLHLNVDYVDLITEPGPDGALVLSTDIRGSIFDKVCFSLKVHNPVAIVLSGHWDCEVEGYVVHHVELDRVPNLAGTGRKRYFTLSGSRLVLRAAPPLPTDVKEWTIVWERVTANAVEPHSLRRNRLGLRKLISALITTLRAPEPRGFVFMMGSWALE